MTSSDLCVGVKSDSCPLLTTHISAVTRVDYYVDTQVSTVNHCIISYYLYNNNSKSLARYENVFMSDKTGIFLRI